jgi:hypothetical protein
MFNKSLSPLVAAGLLGSVFPSVAQQSGQNFPDGAAKNTVVTVCSGRHWAPTRRSLISSCQDLT